MKTIQLTLLLLAICSTYLYTQSAEEILAKYTEVTGGQERWDQVHSMKVTGTAKLIAQNMELHFTRIRTRKGPQITSLKVNGMDYIETAFDGTMVWGSNNTMQPAEKDADASENVKRAIPEFPYPAHNWKANGFTAKYLGKEHLDSIEVFKIKLTKRPQLVAGEEVENSMIYYFDTKRYVPVLTETMTMSGPSKGQLMRATLSDYREVDGYLYPFLGSMMMGDQIFQVLETETVEFNGKIEDSIFKMPGG